VRVYRVWLIAAALVITPSLAAWAQTGSTSGKGSQKSGGTSRATKRKPQKSSTSGSQTTKAPAQKKPASGTQTGQTTTKPDAAKVDPGANYGALPLKTLFGGRDLKGWHLRHPEGRNAWHVADGVLSNTQQGTDLVTDEKFDDFELHAEVNVPKGGNSGIYLQGRYEVQIADSAEVKELSDSMMGAIYGKIAPFMNAAKPAGEWQTLDIHFMQAVRDRSGKIVQRPVVTIILNDEIVVRGVEIAGVTGGARDNEEGTPGPLMLQGDHTEVQFRNILIRPMPPRKSPDVEAMEQPVEVPPSDK